MMTTYQQLCAILIKEYKLAPERLLLDAPLEELGIDSLGLADLLFNVEDEFKIVLPVEAVQLSTLGDVVCFIDELIAAQQGGAAVTGMLAQAAPPHAQAAPQHP